MINLRHLEDKSLSLSGELPAEEMKLELLDELIHVERPLLYNLEIEKLEQNVLIQGEVQLTLQCECARCLKPFAYPLKFEEWVCHLPLEGEDAAAVQGDCIDLTPYLREDILLAFPQHPLCKPECGGLVGPHPGPGSEPGGLAKSTATSSAWAELNKLKLDK
ncbi:MAG TPA: YceD family protein [Verrucomicrobiae bacterium]|nr:YceD family protein [Verrucomicrobiae bacterium]